MNSTTSRNIKTKYILTESRLFSIIVHHLRHKIFSTQKRQKSKNHVNVKYLNQVT